MDWSQNVHCSCFSPNNFTANVTDHSDHSDTYTCNSTTWHIHDKGCKEYVEEWLSAHILIILMVVFVLAVVEISGSILSMCLYRQASVDYTLTLYR
ncbi:hypothetical protein MHYP_G00163710 [Metynnis hypsauchen]